MDREDFEDADIDWFAVDRDGFVGNFSTVGCGALPRTINWESANELEQAFDYFMNRVPADGGTEVDSDALKYPRIKHSDPAAIARYTRHFLGMASRGLFAYDAFLEGIRPKSYYRVGIPLRPLTVDKVPSPIQEFLKRTTIVTVSFRTASIVEAEEILPVSFPRS